MVIPSAVVETLRDTSCTTVIFAPLLFPKIAFLDVEIMLRAHRRGLPLVALDTDTIMADAKRLYPEATDSGSCSIKRDILGRDPKLIRDLGITLTSDYRAGEKEFESSPQVDYRNRAWMKEVVSQMSSKSAFMAVGAAHLYGSSGVINLLRNQGFRVRRVD